MCFGRSKKSPPESSPPARIPNNQTKNFTHESNHAPPNTKKSEDSNKEQGESLRQAHCSRVKHKQLISTVSTSSHNGKNVSKKHIQMETYRKNYNGSMNLGWCRGILEDRSVVVLGWRWLEDFEGFYVVEFWELETWYRWGLLRRGGLERR